jgi:hypothetical protein
MNEARRFHIRLKVNCAWLHRADTTLAIWIGQSEMFSTETTEIFCFQQCLEVNQFLRIIHLYHNCYHISVHNKFWLSSHHIFWEDITGICLARSRLDC